MKKIVLFGDSITAGYLDQKNTDILDELIEKHLADMGFPGYTFINHGVNGETSKDALARVGNVKAEEADFVTVFFGDNDAINQKVAVADYQANLEKIVEELGGERVFVYGPTFIKTVAPQMLAQYVEAAKEASKNALAFTDLYHHMTIYPGTEEFLQADGLHLSEAGYDFLAALMARDIKNYLIAQAKA